MLFKDRKDGGSKLAHKLISFRNQKETLVIGLPRGGVVCAYEIASFLHLPLDIVIPRKIGAPFNPELAIGAICNGETVLNTELIDSLDIPESYIAEEIAKEKKEAERREKLFRKGKKPLDVQGKTIIVVDDGVATGATMEASVKYLKKQKAKKILIALPVSSYDALERLGKIADEILCLYQPFHFFAVGQFYEDFAQTTEEEVIALLSQTTIKS